MEALVFKNPNGNDVTTSLKIAEVFGKRHDNVLRDIRTLDCSENFRLLNFEERLSIIKLKIGESRQTYYEITKDGFSFLVMGYTGDKAGKFKEDFINEFNKVGNLLKNDEYILERAFGILSTRTKQLEEALKLQAPKVEYYDKVLNSGTLLITSIIAAQLGLTARKLNEILKEKGVQHKVGGIWTLTVKYAGKGYASIKTYPYQDSEGNNRTSHLLVWTEKGREFIMNLIGSKGNKAA